MKGGAAISVIDKKPDGTIYFSLPFDEHAFFQYLAEHGEMPLPPYIERMRKLQDAAPSTPHDQQDYQTIFARRQGAVAAPTAGLHIDHFMREKLEDKGICLMPVTLLVGAGTFLPVKVQNIADHKMHAEWGEISKDSAKRINQQKAAGKRVIALGTTSLRILESVATSNAASHLKAPLTPFAGKTDIFITPGYDFKIVDALITNFHLPKSTLFMLVSAFCGRATMQAAYRHAVDKHYRFFSYGDACLLERGALLEEDRAI